MFSLLSCHFIRMKKNMYWGYSFRYRALDQSSGSLSCLLENCLIPSPPDRTPLVKLYLVFLFHPRIETLSVNDSPDVLDRQKCLAALASLRHAKWFQVCILFLYLSLSRKLVSCNCLTLLKCFNVSCRCAELSIC